LHDEEFAEKEEQLLESYVHDVAKLAQLLASHTWFTEAGVLKRYMYPRAPSRTTMMTMSTMTSGESGILYISLLKKYHDVLIRENESQ